MKNIAKLIKDNNELIKDIKIKRLLFEIFNLYGYEYNIL